MLVFLVSLPLRKGGEEEGGRLSEEDTNPIYINIYHLTWYIGLGVGAYSRKYCIPYNMKDIDVVWLFPEKIPLSLNLQSRFEWNNGNNMPITDSVVYGLTHLSS